MFRKILAVAAITLATATMVQPAMAQHGGGHGGGHNGGGHGGGHYSGGHGGWGHGSTTHHGSGGVWLGATIGSVLGHGLISQPRHYDGGYPYGGYSGYGGYNGYGGYPPQAPNAWGLQPNQCRWDREFGYWYNRPADVDVQRCADRYGSVYVVQGSQRLVQYR